MGIYSLKDIPLLTLKYKYSSYFIYIRLVSCPPLRSSGYRQIFGCPTVAPLLYLLPLRGQLSASTSLTYSAVGSPRLAYGVSKMTMSTVKLFEVFHYIVIA